MRNKAQRVRASAEALGTCEKPAGEGKSGLRELGSLIYLEGVQPMALLGFTDPVSSWTHLAAAVTFLLGAGPLIYKGRGNRARIVSLIVFSFTLVFLFSMSGVFHLLDREGAAREVMQRLDHAGIWALIAGTFTPIHVILFRGPWRWAYLLIIWALAITGLVLEVVFFKDFPEWLLLSFFLGLGWMGALSGLKFRILFRDSSLKFLIAGGVAYSIGAVFDFVKWPIFVSGLIGPHEIFHLFVIAGASFHWLFIYKWSDHPIANEVLLHVRVIDRTHYIATASAERIHIEAESIEALRIQIQKIVGERFHPLTQPRIRLRYYQEEYL